MNEELVTSRKTQQKTQVATPQDLAAAREGRGMSQVDISQRIKLQVRQVNALEQGQWDALPGKSFVRGALRSYGKLLDADVTPLLESIGGFAEPAQVHGMRSLDASISKSSGRGFNSGGRGSPIFWVIAGLIGVVALVLYFGSDHDASRIRSWFPSGDAPSGTPVDPAPAPASAPLPLPSSSPTPSPDMAPLPTAAADPSTLPSPSASPSAATDAAGSGASDGTVSTAASSASSMASSAGGGTVAPVQSAAAPPADAKGLIRFSAADDSWVEVRQADGLALHNGLVKAGSSVELKGKPPYRLVLGNASRLEVVYEGKVRDLAPHTRANNIARLQLK